MSKIKKMATNRIFWLACAGILVLGAFLLWPRGCERFREVSNLRDLRLLLQLHQDIINVEKWNPHFATYEQTHLFVTRIYENTENDLRAYIQCPSNEMDPKIREAQNFQNILIRELIQYEKMPPLDKLRKKGKKECIQKIREICGKIVEEKKNVAISRFLFEKEGVKSKDEPSAMERRIVRIQNVFWKNDLRYCPQVRKGWFGTSWKPQERWVKGFHQAVEQDIIPLLGWYDENEKYRTISPVALRSDEAAPNSSLVLRLAASGDGSRSDFIRDGWRVCGNYTLFISTSQGNGISKEISTGIDSCRIQLIPDKEKFPQSTLAPVSSSRKVYSNSWDELRIVEGATVYSTHEVSRFLRQLGIPKGFSIRILKVSSDALFEKVVITYRLEHPDLPGWKSSQFELCFGNQKCIPSELEKCVANDVKIGAGEAWKHVSGVLSALRLFPCNVREPNDNLTATVLLKPGDLTVSFDLWLDDQFRFQFQDSSTEWHHETILNQLFHQDSELQAYQGVTRIETLQFGKKIEGRGVIASCAFENSEENPAKNVPFRFWISADGKVDSDCKTALNRTQQVARAVIYVQDALTPEELRERMRSFLSEKYPKLAPSLRFRVSKGSVNQLCCELTLQVADYPRLPLGMWIYENEEQIQKCVTEVLEWKPEATADTGGIAPAVSSQWNAFNHPCYGPVKAEITGWDPTSSGMPLEIQNTFYAVKSEVGISWKEPLQLTEDGAWAERDIERVATQIEPQWSQICSITNTLLAGVSESGLHVQPEMEEEWIQMKPLKFTMGAAWAKPLGIPIHFEVGHVRISATELELPGRYALGVDHTFWLPFAGVTNPRVDLDFEKRKYAAGLTMTPPVESLYRDIPEEGFDLEEYESPEMSEEERKKRFRTEAQYLDDNPWEDLVSMDLQGSADTKQLEYRFGGDFLFGDSSCASVDATFAPFRFAGGISTQKLQYNEDVGGDVPVRLDGRMDLRKEKSEIEAVTTMCGFSGGGKFGIRSEEKAIYDVGFSVPIPALSTLGTLNGNIEPSFKVWNAEATGTVAHPFAKFMGTLQYGLRVWKTPQTGQDFKLVYQWVTPDGRTVSLEKEFSNAQSLDEEALKEEILEEMKQLEKEEEAGYDGTRTGSVAMSDENMKDLARIGEAYEDFQPSDAQPKAIDPANPQDVQKALDALSAQSAQAQEVLEKTGQSEKAEGNPVKILGTIDWHEENGYFVVRDMTENKELFRVSKYSAGFTVAEDPEMFFGKLHYDDENQTGIIVCIDPESFRIGTPMFRRIFFDSPRTVEKTEKIVQGSWDNRYELIRPFFPNSLKIMNANGVTMSEEAFKKECLAVEIASRVLFEDAVGNKVGGQSRHDDVVSYDNETCEMTFVSCIGENDSIKRMVIPWEVIPESEARGRIIQMVQEPSFRLQLPRISIVSSSEYKEGTPSLLIMGVNSGQLEDIRFYFHTPEKRIESIEISLLYESSKSQRVEQAFAWLLHQYVTEALPIQTSRTRIFLGDAGVGVVHKDSENKERLYLISELNLESSEHPAICLDFETWRDWNSESIRFLPNTLQRREVRDQISFFKLAPNVVTLWNREAKDEPEHWLASPMGLLISLAEKSEKEKDAK